MTALPVKFHIMGTVLSLILVWRACPLWILMLSYATMTGQLSGNDLAAISLYLSFLLSRNIRLPKR